MEKGHTTYEEYKHQIEDISTYTHNRMQNTCLIITKLSCPHVKYNKIIYSSIQHITSKELNHT
jgi:hypothetical protein